MAAYDILGCQGSTWDSKLAIQISLQLGTIASKQEIVEGRVSLQLGMATIASKLS